MNHRESFLEGVVATLSMLPGVATFGTMAGIAAMDAGLSPAAAMGSSLLMFAGVAQMAAMQLITSDALPPVIIMTAVVINLRYLMYSAALAPHFSHLPARWKCSLSYLLSDQSFAVTVTRAHRQPGREDTHWFYLGAALVIWTVWQTATAVGVFVGASVPQHWSLGFAIPLIFLGLLVPSLVDRATVAAALTGGAVAIAGHGLPMNMGLLLGAFSGIIAGLAVEELAPQSVREKPPERTP